MSSEKISNTRSGARRGLFAAAAVTLALGFAAPQPALALDDDGSENIFAAMIGLLGASAPKEEPVIEYRERAPLVVPSNRQALPQPLPPAPDRARGAWPKNQEQARREEAEREKRRPRNDDVWNPVNRRELDRVRSAGGQAAPPAEDCGDPLGRVCNQSAMWNNLKNSRQVMGQKEQPLVAGREQSRDHLTDPPTGYRKPSTTQKYSFEIRKEDDLSDARAQAIQERRNREDR